MRKQSSIMSSLVVLGLLLLSTMVLAGPLPPANKVISAPPDDASPATVQWYLRNGAFDEPWDGDVPLSWKVYPGNADAYGSFDFQSPDASGEVTDHAFFFQIINDEIKADRNAYLYQELTLSPGDYWLNVHTVIFGASTGFYRSSSTVSSDAYTYMAYYALVPQADAMRDGSFAPDLVSDDAWKELWPYSTICSEKAMTECDYPSRAETVSIATGGTHVFILRAHIKWPDWRAFAYYVFDDLQLIPATPLKDNSSACVTSFCLEGLIRQPEDEDTGEK